MSLLSGAGLAAVAAALLAGCGAAPHGTVRASFQNPQVSFSYPAVWKRHDCSVQPGLSPETITVLTTLKSMAGDVCDGQVWSSRMGANGIIIWWQLADFVGRVHIEKFPGKPTHIGSRDARLIVQRVEPVTYDCGRAGGQKDVVVIAPGNDPSTTFQVEGCFRGPALAHEEATFRKMLASARFAG